jgi:glycosyltransferase involved in cell wall biosynthesis
MKQKKKIIILHVILSKGYAGSEKYVLDLVRYQNKDHKVFLVILKSNRIFKRYIDDKIKTFEIGNFFKKYRVKNIIKKIKPNIVHTHLGEAAKSVNKSPDYKTISTMHINYRPDIYKNSDAIIVSNSSQFNQIKKNFNGKLFRSNLWVNLPKVSIVKSKLKKTLKVPANNFIFGSIGRFHPQKGFDIIIKTFKDLKLKNYTLILIGNGHKEFKNLEQKFNNFRVIGHVKNVSNYYNIFDAGIFMSRWETFGFSLVEAMKFRLPIISSKHIGNKDWIHKFNILKVDQGNKKQLKKHIKEIYKLKNSKKKYDLRIFDYKKNCEAITRIYRKILVD